MRLRLASTQGTLQHPVGCEFIRETSVRSTQHLRLNDFSRMNSLPQCGINPSGRQTIRVAAASAVIQARKAFTGSWRSRPGTQAAT